MSIVLDVIMSAILFPDHEWSHKRKKRCSASLGDLVRTIPVLLVSQAWSATGGSKEKWSGQGLDIPSHHTLPRAASSSSENKYKSMSTSLWG